MTGRFQALALSSPLARRTGGRLWPVLLTAAVALGPSAAARADSFYVASDDAPRRSHASTIVLMREGEHTVLSMQSDYEGPAEDFAMIVPLPAGVEPTEVRALDPTLFTRLERITGPRLEERWEADPCPTDHEIMGWLRTVSQTAPRVRLETELSTGEYDVTVLGPDESRSLEGWLEAHDYRVPEGMTETLAPYVASGMNFLVARVDADRVRFEDGRALLSPLRVRYDSPVLSLPLALAERADGADAQDLVVVVIARNQRYEAASHDNVFVPTNLDVASSVQADFGAFYEALLARTFEQHPDAVITEHSGSTVSCDRCPANATLDADMLSMLGGDVLYADGVQRGSPYRGAPRVRMETPVVSAGLSSEVVRRVLRRHINELRFCYEQSLPSEPTAGGTLEARIDISGTGAVQHATVTLGPGAALDERTQSCVANAFRRWTFPEPSGHTAVHVTSSFTFGDPHASRGGDRPVAYASELIATRLRVRPEGHARELVLRPADPVTGGRELRDEAGHLAEDASPASANAFQARYVIRHAWQGAIDCESPRRDDWDGRPLGADPSRVDSLPPDVAPAHARPTSPQAVPLDEVVLPQAPGAHTETRPPRPQASAPETDGGGCSVAHTRRPRWLAVAIALGLLARRRAVRRARPPRDA